MSGSTFLTLTVIWTSTMISVASSPLPITPPSRKSRTAPSVPSHAHGGPSSSTLMVPRERMTVVRAIMVTYHAPWLRGRVQRRKCICCCARAHTGAYAHCYVRLCVYVCVRYRNRRRRKIGLLRSRSDPRVLVDDALPRVRVPGRPVCVGGCADASASSSLGSTARVISIFGSIAST